MDMKMENTNKKDEINDTKKKCKVLCKVSDIGLGLFLECKEEKPEKCTFSLSFGHSYLCKLQLYHTALSITDPGIHTK